MTMTVILLNLAMSVPAALVFLVLVLLVLRPRPGIADEEGRADWRGPPRRRLWIGPSQCTAASIATATNSSAR
jgi:hypothetical protein